MKPFIFFCFLTLFSSEVFAAPVRSDGARRTIDPLAFFTGSSRSSGFFENRRGDPVRSVHTETKGRLENGALRMEQNLFIGGQSPQHRSWRVRRLDTHHFEATANDMVGTARGTLDGSTFSWTFTLALKPGNPLFNVQMTQHMYFQPDGRTMVNRSVIRKFGVVVAQVTEQFEREKKPAL